MKKVIVMVSIVDITLEDWDIIERIEEFIEYELEASFEDTTVRIYNMDYSGEIKDDKERIN